MTCIVGGGKLGSAIAQGLLIEDPARDLSIVERDPIARESLKDRFPVARIIEQPEASDGVVLVVKPQDIAEAARMVAASGATRVLSVAAGVTRATLQQHLGPDVAVIRAMPNMAAQVQSSATGFCVGPEVSDEDTEWARSILWCLGLVVQVDESQMDAVTGVSGSGIAFVLLLMEALADAGAAAGLNPDDAFALAAGTFRGAVKAIEGGDTPAQLRDRIATPGGTTVVGLGVLESRDIRDVIRDAVVATTERSKELGRS